MDQQVPDRRRRLPLHGPHAPQFRSLHATPIAFLVAYAELAIGLAPLLGIFVRPASLGGLIFMLTLLFSSDYPGSSAPVCQNFAASPSHSVFALLFDFLAKRRGIGLVIPDQQAAKVAPGL